MVAAYLQGRSQEAIANTLNVPIEKLYRLREKVGYHALRIFSLKREPELVSDWLKISLQEHNLGLTPKQWEGYWQKLTPAQRQIVESLKSGKSFEMIAQELKWSTHKVAKEWSKLYLTAQALRNT